MVRGQPYAQEFTRTFVQSLRIRSPKVYAGVTECGLATTHCRAAGEATEWIKANVSEKVRNELFEAIGSQSQTAIFEVKIPRHF